MNPRYPRDSLVGLGLRKAREDVGLSRAELAGLTRCSLASLANIEQGAVPKQSQVLKQAFKAIAQHKAAA